MRGPEASRSGPFELSFQRLLWDRETGQQSVERYLPQYIETKNKNQILSVVGSAMQ